MASVPNMRAAPLPIPAGQTPTAKVQADFASKLAEVPEELLQIPVAIPSGDGATPDGDGDGTETATATTEEIDDAPGDAAQFAALVPLLQSLPAVVRAPAPAKAAEPKIEAAVASAPSPVAPSTPAPAAKPVPTPAPIAPAVASAPTPTGKSAKVKPEAGGAGTDTDAVGDDGTAPPTPSLDAAAKEAVSAAKRVIEAALRAASPALAEAAPKAARAVTSALQAIGNALPHGPGADAKAAADDLVTAASLAMSPATATAPGHIAQPREIAASPAAADRSLDLANEAEWLDRLARDIAQASGNEGTIRFKLHPQTLGSLRVELSQGEHGTSIRLTADTEHARSILADAQPRLVAEARAQGVRIAETHVDLSGSDRQASGDPRRQDDRGQSPIIRTARDAATGADAPERPLRSRSDRYA